jgi:hypothetical protein
VMKVGSDEANSDEVGSDPTVSGQSVAKTANRLVLYVVLVLVLVILLLLMPTKKAYLACFISASEDRLYCEVYSEDGWRLGLGLGLYHNASTVHNLR